MGVGHPKIGKPSHLREGMRSPENLEDSMSEGMSPEHRAVSGLGVKII